MLHAMRKKNQCQVKDVKTPYLPFAIIQGNLTNWNQSKVP